MELWMNSQRLFSRLFWLWVKHNFLSQLNIVRARIMWYSKQSLCQLSFCHHILCGWWSNDRPMIHKVLPYTEKFNSIPLHHRIRSCVWSQDSPLKVCSRRKEVVIVICAPASIPANFSRISFMNGRKILHEWNRGMCPLTLCDSN